MTEPRWSWREGVRLSTPLLILVGSVLGFVALGGPQKAATKYEEAPGAPLVETIQVQPHSGVMDIEVQGVVVPYRTITVAAEVAGRIVTKSPKCEAGEFVERGTVLLEIDSRDYELEVARLESELKQADASLGELDVELENARALKELAAQEIRLQENELKRLQQLPNKFASQTELDKASMAVLTARNTFQSFENQERLIQARRPRIEQTRDHARALLDKARLELDRTSIHAPVAGVITSESVEEGGFVQPGTTLFTLEDTSQAEVICHLKPEEVYWLWMSSQDAPDKPPDGAGYSLPRTPVTVIYKIAGREYGWQGALVRYDGLGMDERTRTVRCRAVVPRPSAMFRIDDRRALAANFPGEESANPDLAEKGEPEPDRNESAGVAGGYLGPGRPPAILPGMYVQVLIHLPLPEVLLRVPERAVQPGNKVWKVAGNRLSIQPLELVRVARGEVLARSVPSLLEVGDTLVVSPLVGARDGLLVRPVPSR